MLNLKKEAKPLEVANITLGSCPVCASYISHQYFMQDGLTKKQSKWFSCQCGVIFQDRKPSGTYDAKYSLKFDTSDNKLKDFCEYPVRIYSPLIEELIYGRQLLLIGRTTAHQERAFLDGGWIAESIDRNEASGAGIIGDFETHDFGSQKYNMLWLYHTLECFSDPVSALKKTKSLLTEDGILFIASPDTDFIHTRGSASFRHWKADYNYIMWNRRAITKQLEQLGFNVIMSRQNCWQRFPETDDFHLIAQTKFF